MGTGAARVDVGIGIGIGVGVGMGVGMRVGMGTVVDTGTDVSTGSMGFGCSDTGTALGTAACAGAGSMFFPFALPFLLRLPSSSTDAAHPMPASNTNTTINVGRKEYREIVGEKRGAGGEGRYQ